jgi:hypothetical protein
LENHLFTLEAKFQTGGNNEPILTWTGEPNYASDGLDPEQGYGNTDFVFRVEYSDADNDPPALANLWIDTNGDNLFDPASEVFPMTPEGSSYSSGVIYTYTTTVPFSPAVSSRKYYFEFSDSSIRHSLDEGSSISAVSPDTAMNGPDVLAASNITLPAILLLLLGSQL